MESDCPEGGRLGLGRPAARRVGLGPAGTILIPAITLIVLSTGLALPQQTARKQQKQPGATVESGKNPPASAAKTAGKQVTAGVYLGSFNLESPTGRFSDAKMAFTDVSNCHVYEFVEPPFADFSLSTVGFFAVKGRVVGKQLRATAVGAVDDTAGRLGAMAGKCSEKRAAQVAEEFKKMQPSSESIRATKIAARLATAKTLSNSGDLPGARRACDDILREAPENHEAAQLRTEIRAEIDKRVAVHVSNTENLFRSGQLSEAARECERASELDPDNGQVQALREKISRVIELLRGR